MDNTKQLNHVSLCSGYSGIGLGLGRVLPNLRDIAHVEIEAFACANLVAKMEENILAPCPIWTNLKTFPFSEFRGKVDVLSGGYPCQPFSVAGKRLGTEDPRHLWPYIAEGIRQSQPRLVFFENVSGHLSEGFDSVLESLRGLGYRVEAGIFSAAEVGAPHLRKRLFILGVADTRLLRQEEPEKQTARPKQFSSVLGDTEHNGLFAESELRGDEVASRKGEKESAASRESPRTDRPIDGSSLQGCDERVQELKGCCDSPREETRGGELPNTNGKRIKEQHRGITVETKLAPPGNLRKRTYPARPNEPQHEWEEPRTIRREPYINRLLNYWRKVWPIISQGMGKEERHKATVHLQARIESAMGMSVNGFETYVDELRLLGNGVVPETAELAFRILSEKLDT